MTFACKQMISIPVMLLIGTFCAPSLRAEIPWQRSPEATFNTARQSAKPILVFVGAEWCHYCEKMKNDTWSDPRIQELIARKYVPLQLDGDRDKRIVKKLGLKGYPATLLYNSEGYFVVKKDGFMPPAQALSWLESNTP